MTSNAKDFLLKRICIYAGQEIDPDSDAQVADMLRRKFDIQLPQRRSMNESLLATTSDHEIIALILQYRSMGEPKK